MHNERFRIDLGCGSVKKEGTLGVDILPLPGVDHVVDVEAQPIPFADQSVEYVHSSHFLEHAQNPTRIFAEISRVCADRARLELWTPYAWSNPAFVLDHRTFLTEDIYLHMCVWFHDFWHDILKARWVLEEFQYVVHPQTLCYLHSKGVSLDFGLRHLQNVVTEFCAHITVHRVENAIPAPSFKRTFSIARGGERFLLRPDSTAPPIGSSDFDGSDKENQRALEEAIAAFSQGDGQPPL